MKNSTPETLVINNIVETHKRLCREDAAMIRALATYAEYQPPERRGVKLADGAPEEVAAVLCLSIRAATNRIVEAEHIVRRLPATLDALHEGIIDFPRVRATYQVTKTLSDEDALLVENAVLSHGPHVSYQEYRRALRRQAMKADPEAAERKRKQKIKDRDVVTRKSEDGSARLVATMSAGEVEATYDVLNHLAHKAESPDDTRSLAQRRADVLLDLVLGKEKERVQANINVTVPLTTLLGLNNQPGELSEYGPITAEQCRELAQNGVFRRIITDDLGHVLDVGRRRYETGGLAERVRMRDRTCRQPGCRVPERRCDVHVTSRLVHTDQAHESDAQLLCKRHRLMHERTNRWIVAQPEPDKLIFVTPSGHIRQIAAERYEEPAA